MKLLSGPLRAVRAQFPCMLFQATYSCALLALAPNYCRTHPVTFGAVISVFAWVSHFIFCSWISGRRSSPTVPPRDARFLIFLLMPNATGDALLGDLEERFGRIASDKTLGPRHAHYWYWFQVVISLRPLAWAFVKRISGLAVAYEAIRRLTR
jgi:hypothetical protein